MDDLIPLRWPEDGARVLDLCQRAADYVCLDYGREPDMTYAEESLTDAPRQVPRDQIWSFGHATGQQLDAIVTCLKGHYEPQDWYLGLLLLDPAHRGRGLGERMAQHIIALAQTDGAACLRVAVLDTNPRARAFWTRLGFTHEKSVTSDDGLLRHVHRLPLRG